MLVRSIAAVAVLGLVGLSPALARDGVTPGQVLAGKDAAKRLAKAERGFAGRIARIGAIMGPDTAAPLHIPTKPAWTHPVRREADAGAAAR